MSDQLVATLNAKLEQLKSRKAQIDKEIVEIEQALVVINRYSSEDYFSHVLSKVEARLSTAASGTTRTALTKQQQIFDGVLSILADGKAKHTEDLLNELNQKGIEVGGDKPLANLSAYLSRAKGQLGLESDRRYGWSIKKQTPSDAATSEGASDGSDLV